jgi:DNA-binding LytR/AlgR family response regulator
LISFHIHIIDDSEDETIDIFCHKKHEEKMREFADGVVNGSQKITCKKDNKTYRIRLDEVFYIETVDERLFIYCEDAVYENRMRLYEAEQVCMDSLFFKASKSMLINIKKIENMKPSLSGRFEITMRNGERLLVSRKYVGELKKMMGL